MKPPASRSISSLSCRFAPINTCALSGGVFHLPGSPFSGSIFAAFFAPASSPRHAQTSVRFPPSYTTVLAHSPALPLFRPLHPIGKWNGWPGRYVIILVITWRTREESDHDHTQVNYSREFNRRGTAWRVVRSFAGQKRRPAVRCGDARWDRVDALRPDLRAADGDRRARDARGSRRPPQT